MDSDNLLDRSFRVMDLIAGEKRPVGFGEVLSRTGINRSTVAKILRILCSRGMLKKGDGGYLIGSKPAEYAGAGLDRFDFLERYRPVVREIAERYGVTVLLLRGSGEETVCIDKMVTETAPAMRSLGSVVEESPVHPWTLARCREEAVEVKARSILKAAKSWPNLPVKLSPQDAQRIAVGWGGDVFDDRGCFFSHVRRIAVKTKIGPVDGGDGILVAGFFPSVELDVGGLVEALRVGAK